MPGPVFYGIFLIVNSRFILHSAPDGYFTLRAPDGQSTAILPKPGYNRNAVEIPSPEIQPEYNPTPPAPRPHTCTTAPNT